MRDTLLRDWYTYVIVMVIFYVIESEGWYVVGVRLKEGWREIHLK